MAKQKLINYIQLGAKYANGKIAKASKQISLEDMSKELLGYEEVPKIPPRLSWYDRLFMTKKYYEWHYRIIENAKISARRLQRAAFIYRAKGMIEKDDFGVSSK